MKNTIKAIILGGSMLTASSAFADLDTETASVTTQKSPWGFEIHTGYHSIYEFRGLDLGDDLWEAGADVSYALSDSLSLSGGIWYADFEGGEEFDAYVGITKSFETFELSAGYTYYLFPNASNTNTQEFYVGASTEVAWGIGLGLTYYYDFDQSDGGYLEFEATKSFALCESVSLDLTAGAAWSFDYNPATNTSKLDDFNHWYASVALPWEIKDGVTLAPYVKFTGAGSDLASENGNSEDLLLGGAVLSISF